MNKTKTSLIFILLILLTLLSGCDLLEIEDYAIVSGMGIDYNNNEYEVTYEIYQENNGQTTNLTSDIKSSKGKTISEAVSKISDQLNKKPYLNHAVIIVMNEEAVNKKFNDILNYLLHDVKIRSACYVMVSKNQSTKQLFGKSKEKQKVIAFDIYKHLDVKEGIIGKWSNCKLNETINETLTQNGTVILPTLTYDDDCDINGVYLINKDNKTIANNNDVFVFQLFNNNLVEGLLDIKGLKTYYINKVNTNIKYIGKILLINIDIKILTYEQLNVEEEVEYIKTIKNELENFILEIYHKYIDLNCDPFRLYKFFNNYQPNIYNQNKDIYYDYLKSINMKIDINIDLLSLGLSEERI